MAYATITNVSELNPKRTYGASTTPTTTQVNTLIDDVAGEINTILQGRGLATPITSPADFVIYLKKANAYGAAAAAEMGMFPEAGNLAYTPHGMELQRIYNNMLSFLKLGSLPVSVQAASPFSFYEQNAGDDEPEDDESWRRPMFGKNKEF